MRTQNEMMDLIMRAAKADERIRAAYMNGSRVNPHVKKDTYQDYDIVYVVTEIQWFIDNRDWLSVFGKPLMIQEPDQNNMAFGQALDTSESYGWLMLFDDLNRIDLHIELAEAAVKNIGGDSLTKLILDKDNLFPALPPPTDTDYHVKRPTQEQYAACCNNFWWCLQNVAKGIARDQLPYAMMMYNQVVREELHRMLDWHIGFQTDFSVSVGMWGKYYAQYLPPQMYAQYVNTYADGVYQRMWEALFAACGLFSEAAGQVALAAHYTYAQNEESGMLVYLHAVQNGTVS